MNVQQEQYLSNWHDNFVSYINGLLGLIETLLICPNATDEDKRALVHIKLKLNGDDVKEIEQSLAERVIKKETLDKIERLDKDLVDTSVERMIAAPLVKDVLKYLTYSQIERSKKMTKKKLFDLQIPIIEE